MSKAMKVWLIVAAALILAGCMIFGGVMSVLGWDFKNLSMGGYETERYDISEPYDSILIITSGSDVVLTDSKDGTSVVCYEMKRMKHTVSVKEGTLVIEVVDTRKWYDHIELNFDTPKVTVLLPEGQYGSLTVRSKTGDVDVPDGMAFESIEILASTGDIRCRASATGSIIARASTGDIGVMGVSAGALDLSVTTGDIDVSDTVCEGNVEMRVNTGDTELENVSCRGLVSYGSTGDISLENVIVAEQIFVERGTGDAEFEACDAGEVFVTTTTGDVKGSFTSDKIFFAQSRTGSVDVPHSSIGGRCEVTTGTGSIRLWIEKQ